MAGCTRFVSWKVAWKSLGVLVRAGFCSPDEKTEEPEKVVCFVPPHSVQVRFQIGSKPLFCAIPLGTDCPHVLPCHIDPAVVLVGSHVSLEKGKLDFGGCH